MAHGTLWPGRGEWRRLAPTILPSWQQEREARLTLCVNWASSQIEDARPHWHWGSGSELSMSISSASCLLSWMSRQSHRSACELLQSKEPWRACSKPLLAYTQQRLDRQACSRQQSCSELFRTRLCFQMKGVASVSLNSHISSLIELPISGTIRTK